MDLEQIRSENLSKEMAYLFGVYLTDGSISNNGWNGYKFQLKSIDNDFVDHTLGCIKKLIPTCSANVKKYPVKERTWKDGTVSTCQDQYSIGVGFNLLGKFFKETTGDKHHIPYLIWDASLIIKKWFIAGVMDGDGWISKTPRKDYKKEWNGPLGNFQYRIGMGGVEDGWIYEFEELLHKIGVETLKRERIISDKRGGRKPMVRFGIKLKSFISHGLFFTIKRKQERIILLRNVQRLDVAGPTGLRYSPIFTET